MLQSFTTISIVLYTVLRISIMSKAKSTGNESISVHFHVPTTKSHQEKVIDILKTQTDPKEAKSRLHYLKIESDQVTPNEEIDLSAKASKGPLTNFKASSNENSKDVHQNGTGPLTIDVFLSDKTIAVSGPENSSTNGNGEVPIEDDDSLPFTFNEKYDFTAKRNLINYTKGGNSEKLNKTERIPNESTDYLPKDKKKVIDPNSLNNVNNTNVSHINGNDYEDDETTKDGTNRWIGHGFAKNGHNFPTLTQNHWGRKWWLENNDGSQDVAENPVGCGIVPQIRESHQEASNRIIGGRVAIPHNWPWVVRLVDGCSSGYCAGTLISQRHLVTAYHCTTDDYDRPCDLSNGKTRAYFERHTFLKEEMANYYSIAIIAFKFPPHANLIMENWRSHDFALGILAEDVRFSQFIRPICIPKQGMDFSGQIATAAGWGKYKRDSPGEHGSRQSPVLKEAKLKVSHKKFKHYKMFGTELRVNGYIQDPCSGDSGGPLMWRSPAGRYVIIGTVFGGGYDCRTGRIASFEGSDNGIWNKISEHSDWIKSTMKQVETNKIPTHTHEHRIFRNDYNDWDRYIRDFFNQRMKQGWE